MLDSVETFCSTDRPSVGAMAFFCVFTSLTALFQLLQSIKTARHACSGVLLIMALSADHAGHISQKVRLGGGFE